MMGRTHKVGGAVGGLTILNTLSLCNVTVNPVFVGIPFIAGNYIGALLPDFDQRKSTISRYLWPFVWPIWLLQSFLNLIFKNSKTPIAKAVKSSVNHRGFAHWPILYLGAMLLVFIVSLFFNDSSYELTFENLRNSLNGVLNSGWVFPSIATSVIFSFLYGLCLGSLNHILLDWLNPNGVPILAPLKFKRYHCPFIKITTGQNSKSEHLFRWILKALLVILLVVFIVFSFEFFVGLFGPKEVDLYQNVTNMTNFYP